MRIIAFILALMLGLSGLYAGCAGEAAEVFQAPKQIVVTFTGDCTLGCDILQRGKSTSFEAYVDQYGYEYPFAKVRDIFEQDDLTVINLEGVFKDDDENQKVYKKSGYHFRGPTDYAKILPLSGIEAVSFANNHVLDYGVEGQMTTIAALEAQGTGWFCTNANVNKTFIFEKDGIKIGFVGAYISDWMTTSLPLKDQIKQDFQDLRDAGCQVLIGCMHGGSEYRSFHEKDSPSAYQEKMANAFIKYGADIVVGHHPHTIQGMRVENGVTTLWCLGNFCFGGNPQIKNNQLGESSISTYLAQFTFSFDEDGTYLGHQLNIIPCHTSGTAEYNDYQPHPVSGKDAETVLYAIWRDTSPYAVKQSQKPYVEGVGAIQDFVPAPVR